VLRQGSNLDMITLWDCLRKNYRWHAQDNVKWECHGLIGKAILKERVLYQSQRKEKRAGEGGAMRLNCCLAIGLWPGPSPGFFTPFWETRVRGGNL
jgi:hypothetical protein